MAAFNGQNSDRLLSIEEQVMQLWGNSDGLSALSDAETDDAAIHAAAMAAAMSAGMADLSLNDPLPLVDINEELDPSNVSSSSFSSSSTSNNNNKNIAASANLGTTSSSSSSGQAVKLNTGLGNQSPATREEIRQRLRDNAAANQAKRGGGVSASSSSSSYSVPSRKEQEKALRDFVQGGTASSSSSSNIKAAKKTSPFLSASAVSSTLFGDRNAASLNGDGRTEIEKWLDGDMDNDAETSAVSSSSSTLFGDRNTASFSGNGRTEIEKWFEDDMDNDAKTTAVAAFGAAAAGSGDMNPAKNDGLWDWIKSNTVGHKLYPASSPAVRDAIPEALRGDGSLPLSVTGRRDKLNIHVTNRVDINVSVSLERIQGVANAYVYPVAGVKLLRSSFFKYKDQSPEPVFVDVTFTHPTTGKRITMQLYGDMSSVGRGNRNLTETTVWATPRSILSGLRLVLRFDARSQAEDPPLSQIIVMYDANDSDSAVDASASLLSPTETKLVEHVLSGKNLNLHDEQETQGIAASDSARVATAMAVSQLRVLFPALKAVANTRTPTVVVVAKNVKQQQQQLLASYATEQTQLCQKAQKAGGENQVAAAQRRGKLVAAAIAQKLRSMDNDGKRLAVLHSLNDVAALYHMLGVKGTPASAQLRVQGVWKMDAAAVLKEPQGALGLYNAYFA